MDNRNVKATGNIIKKHESTKVSLEHSIRSTFTSNNNIMASFCPQTAVVISRFAMFIKKCKDIALGNKLDTSLLKISIEWG